MIKGSGLAVKKTPYTEILTDLEMLTLCQADQIRREMIKMVGKGDLSVGFLSKKHGVTMGVIESFIKKHEWQVCNNKSYKALKPDIQSHIEIRLDMDKITLSRIGLKFGTKTNTWRIIQNLNKRFEGASDEDKARARQCAIETFNLKTVKS